MQPSAKLNERLTVKTLMIRFTFSAAALATALTPPLSARATGAGPWSSMQTAHQFEMTQAVPHSEPVKNPAASIPWKTVILTEEGKHYLDHCETNPMINPSTGTVTEGKGCVDLTLARVVAHALYAGMPGEKPDADVTYPRAVLAHEIETDPPAALTVEQAATIKRLIGANYPAIVVGQVFPLLFPHDVPAAIK